MRETLIPVPLSLDALGLWGGHHNIPVNLVTAAGTGTISVLTGCCFVAKDLLCATTTINVSIPTTVGKTLEKTFVCTRNVI